ncbi:hypothetical protein AncyloWKF20_19785 [Ancylobacter sp. WKF20]|uniref:hypothetical protein n=1 Tax=Ancylobacter sp. WKF20 TaxID=3039801 RepID=UPI0024341E80|nr:hypothetical protein [Ancylobacter sp. WKF20]WGD32482.1 hypothetical protein AncyloWKF20_19785 [Ancylobacter sp. WKF20]
MIRFLLRFLGIWLMAGGFVALVLDGVRSIASAELVATPLGVTWLATHEESLAAFQQWIGDRLPAGTWDLVVAPILQAPLFLVLAVIGLVLMLLGRPRAD